MSNRHFFNVNETLVHDALQALAYTNPSLTYNAVNKSLIDSHHDGERHVTLISGGGAGHEPAFAGYVGSGMLNAAVSGNIFASPSIQQITSTVAQVGGAAGTILIIMNYTGDVLHFHLAAEKARVVGLDTKVLVVGDDVSVGRKRSGRVGRRGLAGTILVHKIVGGASRGVHSLQTLLDLGDRVCRNLVTVGSALDHVHIPGRASQLTKSATNQVELGMGIHNEPGCRVIEPQPLIGDLVNQMLDQLLDANDADRAYVKFGNDDSVVLLVNNLGGLSQLEFGAIVKVVCEQTSKRISKIARIYSGIFMTSLDSKGFSVTLLKADEEMLQCLDLPVTVPGWSVPPHISSGHGQMNGVRKTAVVEGPNTEKGSTSRLQLAPDIFNRISCSCCASVLASEDLINYYDAKVGDGDCGSTLARAARTLQKKVETCPGAFGSGDVVKAIECIAEVVEDKMDGTSGALYAIFFNALAARLKEIGGQVSGKQLVNQSLWAEAAKGALNALYKATPARPGERTLIDALGPFVEVFASGKGLAEAVDAAVRGKESTKGMAAVFGRAVYVPESTWSEVPDPGAEGVVCIVKGLLEASP